MGGRCNGPTHRLQPASPHATNPTPSHLIISQASNPHIPNPQNPTPHNTHTASDPPSHIQNEHARNCNNTTNPNLHPKMPPHCPTITRTAGRTPHHPSDGSAPPEFFSLSCHHPTSCSHTEKKILHDHSTLCALTECVPSALPTNAKSAPPSYPD